MEQSPSMKAADALSALEPALRHGDGLLVAVSGGADSVTLAHLLRRFPYRMIIGHIDHGLRKNSAADAAFVRRLAGQWDVPFFMVRVPVRAHARRRKLGIEEAARDLRYAALARLARRARCVAVVTAHTADDQAETILFNFLRGAGPSGLAGMPTQRPLDSEAPSLRLVRPFLSVWRSEINLYLKQNSLPWREDKTNTNLNFSRNWIRHRLLPQLETRFPGLRKRLMRNAPILREEESFWTDLARSQSRKTMRKVGSNLEIDLNKVFGYHGSLARRILRFLIPGLSLQEIASLQQASAGRYLRPVSLSGGRKAVRRGRRWVIRP